MCGRTTMQLCVSLGKRTSQLILKSNLTSQVSKTCNLLLFFFYGSLVCEDECPDFPEYGEGGSKGTTSRTN
ncbi:unnamed protein product [Ixodes pacificus]